MFDFGLGFGGFRGGGGLFPKESEAAAPKTTTTTTTTTKHVEVIAYMSSGSDINENCGWFSKMILSMGIPSVSDLCVPQKVMQITSWAQREQRV